MNTFFVINSRTFGEIANSKSQTLGEIEIKIFGEVDNSKSLTLVEMDNYISIKLYKLIRTFVSLWTDGDRNLSYIYYDNKAFAIESISRGIEGVKNFASGTFNIPAFVFNKEEETRLENLFSIHPSKQEIINQLFIVKLSKNITYFYLEIRLLNSSLILNFRQNKSFRSHRLRKFFIISGPILQFFKSSNEVILTKHFKEAISLFDEVISENKKWKLKIFIGGKGRISAH